ncbi:hypothetical protein D9611_005485 [Ephemerocybe angulata]|uniref:Uncharacterized protein n=1 Tax=Ephemerocybe angulata TaxID=980116 RepID=A0A8H5C0N6_9AGAR|nr:hypothetical protein D9611_005485 [Tulosesus angulatus]
MAISVELNKRVKGLVSGVEAGPFRAVVDALEVGISMLLRLGARAGYRASGVHANGEHSWGVNGDTGKIVDVKEDGMYGSASVKIQTLKTAIEASRMLLRVDDVVQAVRKGWEDGQGRTEGIQPE